MKTPNRAHLAALVVFTGIAVGLHLPGLLHGPTLDGAVFTEIAVGLRSGLLPYRDLWDHKPPGVYVAFALAQALLPGSNPWLGPWLLTTGSAALIAALTYLLLLPTSRRAALIAGAVVASYVSLYPIALGGGQTEPLATAAGLTAFVIAVRTPGSPRRVFVGGVLLGIAMLTSILALPVVLGVVMVLARVGARASLCLAALVTGAGTVGAITLLLLWAAAILPEAWSAIVTYNAVYGALNREHVDGLIAVGLVGVFFLAPLLVPCAAALLHWGRSGRAVNGMAIGAAVWVAFATLEIVGTGRIEPHYLIFVMPPLVLLAIPAARTMLVGARLPVAGIALIIATVVVAVPAGSMLTDRARAYTSQAQVQEVAAWLRVRATAVEQLFVWGNEPALYYESGLSPATAFVYVMPVLTPGYGGPDLSTRVALDLGSDLPRYVIDAGSTRPGQPGIVPLLVPRSVFEGDGRTLDSIDPIRDLIRDNYGPPIDVAGWLIYERVPVARMPLSASRSSCSRATAGQR